MAQQFPVGGASVCRACSLLQDGTAPKCAVSYRCIVRCDDPAISSRRYHDVPSVCIGETQVNILMQIIRTYSNQSR